MGQIIKQSSLCAATLGILIFALPASSHAETVSSQDAARMMIQMRDACNLYVNNGERFWSGEFKKLEDAPGLVLLNREIKTHVRKARSADWAKEIAWQKCLDFVFNNQNSKGYVN